MKRLLKDMLFPTLLVIFLIIGYFIGHKIGRMYGAQQYTKKLWQRNEIQISSAQVLDKINEYRQKNNLAPLKETIGLCRLARYRANEAANSFGSKWSTETQKYEGVKDVKEIHETKLTFDKAKELCPECILETMQENAYISVRPEPCFNLDRKKICKGGEYFGVVEDYVERVVDGWINSPDHNKVLLSEATTGCVGSYGGIVMLNVAQTK